MTKRPISRGEMISTLCFAGVGLWLMGTALEGRGIESIALYLCAVLCLAAAARHPIARLVERIRQR